MRLRQDHDLAVEPGILNIERLPGFGEQFVSDRLALLPFPVNSSLECMAERQQDRRSALLVALSMRGLLLDDAAVAPLLGNLPRAAANGPLRQVSRLPNAHLLGTMPDSAIAARLNCARTTVGQQRRKRGIPPYQP